MGYAPYRPGGGDAETQADGDQLTLAAQDRVAEQIERRRMTEARLLIQLCLGCVFGLVRMGDLEYGRSVACGGHLFLALFLVVPIGFDTLICGGLVLSDTRPGQELALVYP